MDIAKIREAIPATSHGLYFNTGWSGPSPRPVVERIKEWLEYESYNGPTSKPVFERHIELMNSVRSTIASFVGATADEITLTQNTTEGIHLIINGIQWKPGDEMIICDLEHPSVSIPAYYMPKRQSVTLKILDTNPTASKAEILEMFAKAISHKTKLVFFSHVQYACGLKMPLAEIAAMAHHAGAWVLVDGAQAAGHLDLDMRVLDADFYCFPGHKWILGPDGIGATYIKKDLIGQIETSKMGNRSILNSDRRGNYTPNVESIRKFELTTTSAPLWAGMEASIKFLLDVGKPEIEERSRSLASIVKSTFAEIPGVHIHSPTDPLTSCGLTTFSIDGWEPKDVVDALWTDVQAVTRTTPWPAGVRLSTAFFNTEDEISRVRKGVEKLAESRKH
ncbi:MAG: aminotransferase class V-fold PLP-dependent enzyme [Dehalococcoidia bacterium]|nr:aminotransferase class V-fold PLP-dependent enzyme [Dehalococcoidia bacterium]